MRTTPTGEEFSIYRECTKGELFYCAVALYNLQKGDHADIKGLKAFVKAEAKLWLKE